MNLLQAVQSGKRFSRDGKTWRSVGSGQNSFSEMDVTAEDWQLEPEKIDLDATSYWNAVAAVLKKEDGWKRANLHNFQIDFARSLLAEIQKK